MAVIGFIGLGVMGFPMAGHLAKAGHELHVYNRSPEKSRLWCERHEGKLAQNPAEAALGADVVISCVGNDDDLRAVTLGEEGAFGAMKPGTLYIDHSTVSATIARELFGIGKQKDIGVLDAPISGGQAGAENGALAVMCGGEESDFAKAKPIMTAYGKIIERIGEAGAGQLCKMVNQIAIAGLLQGLSEAMAFLQKSGLDGEKVLGVIEHGAAGSWQMSNRARSMLEGRFDFGFAIDWMRKDLGIVLEEGERIGAPLEVTKLVEGYYRELQEAGHGRHDSSVLIERLK